MTKVARGIDLGLAGCRRCHKVCQLAEQDTLAMPQFCPRCGARLHLRKPHSLERTWALILAAFICFFPANLYPMMTVTSLGRGDPSTIMEGVITLVQHQMYGIALVVFVASVAVPLLKLVGLAMLLLGVQGQVGLTAKQCTVIYRLVEIVGRWSMLDLFVIAILVALVDLGAIAKIEAGPAALAFGLVVVLTMLAAMSFDPRLLWDNLRWNKEWRDE